MAAAATGSGHTERSGSGGEPRVLFLGDGSKQDLVDAMPQEDLPAGPPVLARTASGGKPSESVVCAPDGGSKLRVVCVDDLAELRPLAALLARRAALIGLCIDASDPDSLESARLWYDEAVSGLTGPRGVVVVVIGSDSSANARIVEVTAFADSIDATLVTADAGEEADPDAVDASAAAVLSAFSVALAKPNEAPQDGAKTNADGPAAGADAPSMPPPALGRMASNMAVEAEEHVPSTAPAVVVAAFGGPEALTVVDDHPVPRPGPGECLIRVRAVGINPVDTYVRSGSYARLPQLPYTPGLDCAGEVVIAIPGDSKTNSAGEAAAAAGDEDADGDDLPAWATPGRAVFTGAASSGSYATYAVAPLSRTFPFRLRGGADEDDALVSAAAAAASSSAAGDDNGADAAAPGLTWAQAAAVPTAYFTAYRALTAASGPPRGGAVLVHGASGGVGLAAVELACRMGCRVVGTASSDEGRDAVLAAGAVAVTAHGDVDALRAALLGVASDVSDDDAERFTGPVGTPGGPPGFRVIVENLANANLGTDLTLLGRGGRVAVVGSRGEVTVNPRDLMAREASVHGVALAAATDEDLAAMADKIGAWLAGEGNMAVRPTVGWERTGLSAAAEAHEEVMAHTGGARGKVVLVLAGDEDEGPGMAVENVE